MRSLVNQVHGTFSDIETQQPDKVIASFTIGKTHAKRRSKNGGGYMKFDRKKQSTWKLKEGISNKWSKYEKDGYSGLIALTAVTTDIIPSDVKRAHRFIDKEQYCIALEQQLIQYYMLERADSRLENTSFNPGNLCKKGEKPYACIVYVAYKLKDREGYQIDGQEGAVEESSDTSDSELSINHSSPATVGDDELIQKYLDSIPGSTSVRSSSDGSEDAIRPSSMDGSEDTPGPSSGRSMDGSEDTTSPSSRWSKDDSENTTGKSSRWSMDGSEDTPGPSSAWSPAVPGQSSGQFQESSPGLLPRCSLHSFDKTLGTSLPDGSKPNLTAPLSPIKSILKRKHSTPSEECTKKIKRVKFSDDGSLFRRCSIL
ncbi:uncharacterized protein [Amphiura filiformis]|uniref:uncharacterized protein n=1 Tax=Amphiura filiformis TaxID=82378 RepID=UPI003B21CB6D